MVYAYLISIQRRKDSTMTASATLVHTSSRTADNALRVARVAAAGRRAAERQAAERGIERNRVQVQAWVDTLLAEGAVEVGTKVCLADGGKWRPTLETFAAAESIARWIADGDGVEAWGIDDAGLAVGEVLSVW
jgi:hypothetical protein